MNNTTLIIYSITAAVVWFAPIFVAGWMARHWFRKDGDKVILIGLFFGIIGAAIAAIALPRLSDEAWEAKGQKHVKVQTERGEMDVLIAALIGGCAISGGLLVALMMI